MRNHIWTAEGKRHRFVAIDRTSKFAFVRRETKATRTTAPAFLVALIKAVRSAASHLLPWPGKRSAQPDDHSLEFNPSIHPRDVAARGSGTVTGGADETGVEPSPAEIYLADDLGARLEIAKGAGSGHRAG